MEKFSNLTGGLLSRSASILILFIIPGLLLIQSQEIIKKRDKNWYGGGYDPSYAYLYNSLNIARFRIPGHHDHPGTPMQIIGAVVLQSAWMINPYGGENLTQAVIKEPEYYLKILNKSVAILASVSIFLLGLFLFWSSRNIWYALLLQVIPFISNLILYNGFIRITQESVLMISCIAMSAFALHWYFNKDKYSPRYFIVGFGLIAGFGIASKITFLPLMIIPVIIFFEKKKITKLIKITAITFIISTMPILLRYPNMGWWFIKLFIFSGLYGTGKIQVIEPISYLQSLKELFYSEPLYMKAYLFLIAFLLVTLLINKVKSKPLFTSGNKLLIAIFLVQSAGFIITAKHPKLAYLLPYECITPIGIIIILHKLSRIYKNKLICRLTVSIITIVLVILTINHGRSALGNLYSTTDNLKYEQEWKLALSTSKNGALIGINPGPSPIAATYFSNVYSRDRYAETLLKIYPDYYIFDTYGKRLINWTYDTLTIEDLAERYNKIVIIGEDVDQLIDSINNTSDYNFVKIPTEKAEIAVLDDGTGVGK